MTKRIREQTNPLYLAMVGKHYHFAFVNPKLYQKDPGYCRVIGVALHELECAELLILEEGASDPDFYTVDDLVFSLNAHIQPNTNITMSNTLQYSGLAAQKPLQNPSNPSLGRFNDN
jgi:hypothetical protein